MKTRLIFLLFLATAVNSYGAVGQRGTVTARAAAKQNVFTSNKPKTAASMAAQDVENNPCKKEYWGCMDQFCMMSNENGGRCGCSNDSIKLNKDYSDAIGEKYTPSNTDECEDDDISCKIGAAKYSAATKMCEEKTSPECKSNFSFTKLQYSQNIRNDCSQYQIIIKDTKEKGAVAEVANRANARAEAMEKFESMNKLNESECLIDLKKCMNTEDACGKDWSRCTESNISEKRPICEKIMNDCDSVRESVWNGFVAEITPTLKSGVLTADNTNRQSCVKRISDCVVKSCKDNITGLGETMDGCLARPEMVQSFCKIEMDDCDKDGNLWTYVKQKLAGMRTDRCAEEVRECFTSENACGADFSKCIGMGYKEMHEICPIDKLVVCKQDNTNFALSDVDDLIGGIMTSMDNKLQETCRNLIDEKMGEVCGGIDNCKSQFMGRTEIESDIIWTTVPLSNGSQWVSCKNSDPNADCSEFMQSGIILVDEYVKNHSDQNQESLKNDLSNAQAQIQSVIDMIEKDSKVSWCISGRDISQINGTDSKTDARFPTMTQDIRGIIAISALDQFRIRTLDKQNQAGKK
jgi:hypothetical protein